MKSLVYIVDDDEISWSTLAFILNQRGVDAEGFTNPLKALEAAAVKCPDFLLTDISMFQMNGVDLGLKFHELYPQCKVILFSGNKFGAPLIERAERDGHFFTFLQRPLHPRDLLNTLRQMGATVTY